MPISLSKHPTLAAKIVSHWRLREAAGTTRLDSKSSNNLTDNNTVGVVVGVQANAANFETTSSQYLSIADASQTGLDPLTGDFAYSFWVKPDNIASSRAIFGKGATSNNATEAPGVRGFLSLSSGIVRLNTSIADNGSTTRLTHATPTSQSPPIYTDNWSLIFMLFDRDGNYTPYINNVVSTTVLSIAAESGTIDVSAAFALGASPVNGGGQSVYGDGAIDEFTVYNALPTVAEMTDVYNGGNGIPWVDPVADEAWSALGESLLATTAAVIRGLKQSRDREARRVIVRVAGTQAFRLNYFEPPDFGTSYTIAKQVASSTVTVDGGTAGYTQSAELDVPLGHLYKIEVYNPNATAMNYVYDLREYTSG